MLQISTLYAAVIKVLVGSEPGQLGNTNNFEPTCNLESGLLGLKMMAFVTSLQPVKSAV